MYLKNEISLNIHNHMFLYKSVTCPPTRRSGVLRTHLLCMVRGATELRVAPPVLQAASTGTSLLLIP